MNLLQVWDVLLAGALWLLVILPGGMLFAVPMTGSKARLLLIPAGLSISALLCSLGLYLSLTVSAVLFFLMGAAGLFFMRNLLRSKDLTREIVMACLVLLVIRLYPLTVHPEPRGFDPWFHLLLAQKILNSGSVATDWLPFAPIGTVNYPTAMHTIMAVMGKVSGLPLPLIFSSGVMIMVLVLGIQIFLTLKEYLPAEVRYRYLPHFSAISFMAVFDLGAFDYAFWGGLPNLLGMCILFGFVTMISDEEFGTGVIWALPLLLIGVSLIHHHVMLVAGILLAAEFFCRLRRRSGVKPLAVASFAAAVAGSWYYLPYAMKALRVSDSAVLSYKEPMLTPLKIFQDGGPLFCILVVIGAGMFLRNRREVAPHLPPGMVRAAAVLSAVFVFAEYIVRFLSPSITGREINLFTPSRFFTDAVPFLSVFAGMVLCTFAARFRPFPVMLAAVAAGFVMHLPKYAVLLTPEVRPEKMAAFEWVREHTTPDTLVVDAAWSASYFTWRPASHTPVPSSEFIAPVYARYHAVRALLETGTVSESLTGQQIVCIATEEEIRRLPVNAARLWPGEQGLGVYRLK